jgi:DNA-binding NtrC family response regulator
MTKAPKMTIALIDDDYATDILIEHLIFRGYDARRINSAAAALQSLDDIAAADLVILDIIMERPPMTKHLKLAETGQPE